MKTYPLRPFVQRVLLIRLTAATTIIAVVIGLISYVAAEARLSSQAADLGRRGIIALVEKVRFVMERQQTDAVTALREVLGRGESPVVYRAGRFVAFQVYDHAAAVLAEQSAADQPGIDRVKALLAGRPPTFPGPGRDEASLVRVDGVPFVLVTGPIADKTGKTVAFARGMFAVSPEASAEMRGAAVRSVLFVLMIVVAVAALLYPVILQLTRRLADYSTSLLDANLEMLDALGCAIAKRDSDTDAHNYRVTLYSTRIGEAMGLSADEMRSLIKGSFLHDVGKIGIPDRVLLKPGKLDEGEFTVMKTHVEKGVDIVNRSSWLRDGAAVAGHHHEKYAGGGYPHNLKGEDIQLSARIFAVSDVFDALVSHRPYKKPFSFEETMNILEQGRGQHFDPKVLDAFGRIARDLFDRYAGREGADLRQELSGLVELYFSAGMETLKY